MENHKDIATLAASILDQLRGSNINIQEAFNDLAEKKHLGLYLRRGRFYPASLGTTHTSVLTS